LVNPKSHNILSFKIINVHVTCLNLRIVDSLNKYSDPQNTRILKGIDMVIVNNVPKKIACGGLCFKIAWNFINRAVINTFYMPNLKQPPTTRSRMQNTHIDSCALMFVRSNLYLEPSATLFVATIITFCEWGYGLGDTSLVYR